MAIRSVWYGFEHAAEPEISVCCHEDRPPLSSGGSAQRPAGVRGGADETCESVGREEPD